mgnify:FL=1|tara:strand:+ start:8293 stop:9168 length:876 start_codon:yes stop_codon:yes gene_type:complete
MKLNKAYEVLELSNNISYDEKIIKKKYHSLCLKYHPDKNNNDEECKTKFQEINEAYQLLSNKDIKAKYTYENHLYSVLDGILPAYLQNEQIYKTIKNIILTCEKLTFLKLQLLDVNTLEQIHKFLYINKDILYINETILKKIKEIIQDKRKNDECIILLPSLEDLFLNNIYRLQYENETYLIPLWHKKLVYEHNQNELYIKCQTPQDESIYIDEQNNLYLDIEFELENIWGKDIIDFKICGHEFYISSKKLYFSEYQKHTLYNQGITKPNKQNIYDVSVKSDIHLNIHIKK